MVENNENDSFIKLQNNKQKFNPIASFIQLLRSCRRPRAKKEIIKDS
jgi:hypothetical protein